ncbi:MAG TPA: hypothetical protein VLA67_14665 [Nitrospiraceae bacterium]|nr:hypothetical protein [Nitrospiraceae bacterium]
MNRTCLMRACRVCRLLISLAHIIHEDFYCNRRYAATTSLTAGVLAARSVNILFKYASLLRVSARPSRVASRRFPHKLL